MVMLVVSHTHKDVHPMRSTFMFRLSAYARSLRCRTAFADRRSDTSSSELLENRSTLWYSADTHANPLYVLGQCSC